MLKSWDDLDYWDSSDWIKVQEKLDVLDRRGIRYNPSRHNIFNSLDAVPCEQARVVLVGQDPYPSAVYATGFAYSIPATNYNFPPTLHNMYTEYTRDLGYPYPTHGNLSKWVDQGVVLWNAIPTCLSGQSRSHDWPEWAALTREIVEKIPAVFVFMGAVANRFAEFVPPNRLADVVITAHPANRFKQFKGCRLFSTINSKLVHPIDWKLT